MQSHHLFEYLMVCAPWIFTSDFYFLWEVQSVLMAAASWWHNASSACAEACIWLRWKQSFIAKMVGYNKNCHLSEALFPGSPAFVASGWIFLC